MVAFKNPIVYYLVIPSGQTSGKRIVIDGVAGTIQVFDQNNVQVAEIGVVQVGAWQYQGFLAFPDPNVAPFPQADTVAGLFSFGIQFDDPNDTTNPGLLYFQAGVPGQASSTFWQPSQMKSAVINEWQPFILMDGGQVGAAYPLNVPSVTMGSVDESNTSQPCEVYIQGAILYKKPGNTTPESWHALSLNTGWSATFGTPSYRINALGAVEFKGLASKSSAPVKGETIATLPVGYRPTRTVELVGGGDGNATPPSVMVQILTTGDINFYEGSSTATACGFDGMSFYP